MTDAKADSPAGKETRRFETEVSRLLDIVINSLYAHKEIFLRELISNASDACDRLRYAALTEPALTEGDPDFRIRLSVAERPRRVIIEDNGSGMDRGELIENLGTIARSGTAAFADALAEQAEAAKEKAKGDAAPSLIGRFGVGFYSAFMVAEKVEVISRKAGTDEAWSWSSDGTGEYAIEPAEREGRGTTITLTLRKDAKEFADPARLREVVKRYSDHIALPILMEQDGEETTVNAAQALWQRPKREISDEQYTEFYHHVGHVHDEPWLTLHWKAEGKIEYGALLFVPTMRPFDLYDPARKHGIKLYVRRVFITDDCPDLVPAWLRFLRGVVDSEDLPLNISRETLQHNAILKRVSDGVVRRVLSELKKKAEKDPEAYTAFWDAFGPVLKEGLYEQPDKATDLFGVCRFRSTAGEDLTSLSDYVARMPEGQESIFYITGDDPDALRKSPQLEGFAAKGVEVLLLTDPIDPFWSERIGDFEGKPFKSATRGGADLDKIAAKDTDEATDKDSEKDESDGAGTDLLVAAFKSALGTAVRDVRTSSRLTESAVCLVAEEGDLDMRLERTLRQQGQFDAILPRVLEINAGHPLIRKLAETAEASPSDPVLEEAAQVLLDQARIVEGETLPDPAAFATRLSAVMQRALGA